MHAKYLYNAMDMNTSKVEETATNAAQEEEVNTDSPIENEGEMSDGHAEEAPDQGDSSDNSDESPKEEQTDWQDKYMRLYAEFDNFRKRTMRERVDLIRNASKDVLEAILPVMDDFERAEAAAADVADVAGLKEGQALIQNKLKQMLKAQGVEKMDVKSGDNFDVDLHEAITRIPMPELSGKVVDVVEAGYKLNDTVLRYAKVVVGE